MDTAMDFIKIVQGKYGVKYEAQYYSKGNILDQDLTGFALQNRTCFQQ